MGNVTVIGAQSGDEGKGKIVDWLASRADMVVRFQGDHELTGVRDARHLDFSRYGHCAYSSV